MEEWNDKELYHFLALEAVILDNTPIELLQMHLRYYEEREEYMKCAGIKLGIDFARFNLLMKLYKQQINDKRR